MPGSPDGSRPDSTPAATSSALARRPGRLWLLALLIVPLLLTALLVAIKGDGLNAASADEPPATTPPAGEPSPSTSTTTSAPAAAVVAPFSIARTGESVTLKAAVPDQAAKDAITAAMQELVAEGESYVDEVTVDPTAGSIDPAALSALVLALSGGPGDTAVDYDGTTVTLTGDVSDQATKATAARAAAKAVPGAVVADQLRVPSSVKPPMSEACRTFESRLAQLTRRNKIVFLSGTAIVNEASRVSVLRAAALLKTCATARVEIAGHTDNLGDPATSLPLSQRRAEAVKATLVRLGVPAERMISRGYGESEPVASNKTSAGRIANRRVELRVP